MALKKCILIEINKSLAEIKETDERINKNKIELKELVEELANI